MSDVRVDFSDVELEEALVDAGKHLSHPIVPHLAETVGAHLRQHPHNARRFPRSFMRPRMLYPLLAALAVIAFGLGVSTSARTSVASWFRIPGVRIESGTVPPGPLGRDLALGNRTTLADAQKHLPFQILVPTAPDFGKPDEVYVGTPPNTRSVSLLYRARPGLAQAATTGAGLLVGESPATLYVGKMVAAPAELHQVRVRGAPGVWIGRAHYVYYLDSHGKERLDTIRLAGNTLLWEQGGVTLRIEGRISRKRALAIARSMEVAGQRR